MRISISENEEGGGEGEQLISRSERSHARLSWSVDNDQRRRSSLIILHLVSTETTVWNQQACIVYLLLFELFVSTSLWAQSGSFPFLLNTMEKFQTILRLAESIKAGSY